MRARSESRECEFECAPEAAGQPQEIVERLCEMCPWNREYENPELIAKLIHYAALIDSGCPVQRHELTDEEWHLLGWMKIETSKPKEKPVLYDAVKDGNRSRRTYSPG
jgi:hypothetical protein